MLPSPALALSAPYSSSLFTFFCHFLAGPGAVSDMAFAVLKTAELQLPPRQGRPPKASGSSGEKKSRHLVNLPENYLQELRGIARAHNTSLSGAVMLLLSEREKGQ